MKQWQTPELVALTHNVSDKSVLIAGPRCNDESCHMTYREKSMLQNRSMAWERPELTVIIRSEAEENVLAAGMNPFDRRCNTFREKIVLASQ